MYCGLRDGWYGRARPAHLPPSVLDREVPNAWTVDLRSFSEGDRVESRKIPTMANASLACVFRRLFSYRSSAPRHGRLRRSQRREGDSDDGPLAVFSTFLNLSACREVRQRDHLGARFESLHAPREVPKNVPEGVKLHGGQMTVPSWCSNFLSFNVLCVVLCSVSLLSWSSSASPTRRCSFSSSSVWWHCLISGGKTVKY